MARAIWAQSSAPSAPATRTMYSCAGASGALSANGTSDSGGANLVMSGSRRWNTSESRFPCRPRGIQRASSAL